MMKLNLTITVIAIIAIIGNGVSAFKTLERTKALDACAKANNVYSCHMVPQPTEAPRVEYHQAAILPPPVM